MVPLGQHLANLRRKGGLGKDPKRAAARAEQLTTIDADWNCPQPLNWQRHYAVLRDLTETDGHLPDLAPGATFDSDDLGKWLAQQKQPATWAQLLPEQPERLTALGIKPVEAPPPTPAAMPAAKGQGKAHQHSREVLRHSHSGGNGKAPTGPYPAAMPKRSRSTERSSQVVEPLVHRGAQRDPGPQMPGVSYVVLRATSDAGS
ncbi:hypothetical protein GCM10010289_00770 [Streptomyces violascens]|nr:hypothetical protein GCM10010289_00770 [Streptomyces violascens]